MLPFDKRFAFKENKDNMQCFSSLHLIVICIRLPVIIYCFMFVYFVLIYTLNIFLYFPALCPTFPILSNAVMNY